MKKNSAPDSFLWRHLLVANRAPLSFKTRWGEGGEVGGGGGVAYKDRGRPPARSWVYNAPTLIAVDTDPSARGIGVRDKCWEGVYPSNIHREGYRPLDKAYRGVASILEQSAPQKKIHREGYRPLDKAYRGVASILEGSSPPKKIHREAYRPLDRGYRGMH